MRLLAVALLLLPCVASAATVTLTFTLPTSYNDAQGTPLDPANIVSRRVEWTGSCPSFLFVAPQNSIVFPGNATTIAVENVTPGTRCFRVFVTAGTPGCVVSPTEPCFRESPPSNVWTQIVGGAPVAAASKVPNPVTALTGR